MSDVWTPPRAEVKDVGLSGNPDAPEIRRAHLNHEASIKAIGILYYLGAIGAIVGAIGLGLLLIAGDLPGPKADDMSAGVVAVVGVLILALGALYLWLGRGMRTLKSSVRIPAGVLAGLGLLGFPVGTLINSYILYLLFSKKGTMVFSDEYKQIIADTPDIKYRTSIIVWIFLALIVAAIIFGIVAGRSGH